MLIVLIVLQMVVMNFSVIAMGEDPSQIGRATETALEERSLTESFSIYKKNIKLHRLLRKKANIHEIENLVNDNDIDVNAVDESGYTPLMVAIDVDHRYAARFLFIKGADLNKSGVKVYTPLIMAVDHGNLPMIELLEIWGAKIDHACKDGYTALDIAVDHVAAGCESSMPIVKFLLEKKANVHRKMCDGQTCFDVAKESGHEELLELLESYRLKPSCAMEQDSSHIQEYIEMRRIKIEMRRIKNDMRRQRAEDKWDKKWAEEAEERERAALAQLAEDEESFLRLNQDAIKSENEIVHNWLNAYVASAEEREKMMGYMQMQNGLFLQKATSNDLCRAQYFLGRRAVFIYSRVFSLLRAKGYITQEGYRWGIAHLNSFRKYSIDNIDFLFNAIDYTE